MVGSSPAAVPGARMRPSMRDIIGWQREQAFRLGELGFTTDFPNPSSIFKPLHINTAASLDSGTLAAVAAAAADDDDAIFAAMRTTHNNICQLQQRKAIMDKNPALLARTEVDVTHKLLAAGVSKHDLPHLTFRQKVVRLINTAQPRPKHNFVTVWVTPPSCLGGARELVEVQLPLEAEIGQVYQLLREVVEARMAFRRERKKRAVKGADDDDDDDDGGCGGWKYQLLSPDLKRVLIRKSVCMETDGDYRGLVRRIGKEGGRAPVAVLMQEPLKDPRVSDTVRRVEDIGRCLEEEEVEEEVLDEDGNPYFDKMVTFGG